MGSLTPFVLITCSKLELLTEKFVSH
ncbi:MAG: hypothetical protein ACD_16C00088G0001, partial [uncultured bacterium]